MSVLLRIMPGKSIFKLNYLQKGPGPHLDPLVFAADENQNAFHANIEVKNGSIEISDTEGRKKFSIHARWNIEGYGYIYTFADNGGNFYELPSGGESIYNLNFEFADSRVKLNQRRLKLFSDSDWEPSKEVRALNDLSKEYLEDALKSRNNNDRCSRLSDTALKYAMMVSDFIELEKSRFDIMQLGHRPEFLFGCDARGYFQMNKELFIEKFKKLFNYATITHYLKGDHINFEEVEGKKKFAERVLLLKELRKNKIIVEGRPLFWPHYWVTPEWLIQKSYKDLLKYVEFHVKEVVGYYKDEIEVWEVVNELHDWANEVQLNNEQTVEVTKLACEAAREINPKIKLLINNCRPFGEYVQMGMWHNRKAIYNQRTPHQFIEALIDAGVDFDIIGIQVYFSWRSAADTIHNIERYLEFGKKIHLSEVGAPSFGLKLEFIDPDPGDYSKYPYEWRRHWDEELQAEWLEYTFSYAYSKPDIEAANWYDFVDPHAFLNKGGLLRSENGEEKSAVNRLQHLKEKWRSINDK